MKKYSVILLSLLLFACGETVVNDQPCGSGVIAGATANLPAMSTDGIEVPMHFYRGASDSYRAIILLHMANSSSIEYCSIAERLNKMGYNVVSVDLRSGGDAFGGTNSANASALEKGLPTDYLDAYPDIIAVVNQVTGKSNGAVFLWGSSYTAGLAMRLANESDRIAKVIALSPGEYYGDFSLQKSISGLSVPTFVSSSKSEANADMEELLSVVNPNKLDWFVPESEGDHGSRALWESQPSNEEYWTAVEAFLKN